MRISLKNQLVTAIACVWLVASVQGIGSREQAADGTRTIEHRPSVSLRSRILPGDRLVLVTRSVHGIVAVEPPTVAQEARYAAGVSDVVLVADVTAGETVFIEDESWLGTRLKFETIDVVLSDGRTPRGGELVWNGGGELVIDGVAVRAGLRWATPKDKRFLLFLVRRPDTGTYVMSRTPLAIEKDRTFNPWQRDRLVIKDDVLHDQRLADLLELLKKPAR
jgi:hypothetical protein